MKIFYVIQKSFREQIRSFWVLLLTLSMAPLFVLIYSMISQATIVNYDIAIVNNDSGFELESGSFNHGKLLTDLILDAEDDSLEIPLRVKLYKTREAAVEKLMNRKADVLIVLPEDSSLRIGNKIKEPNSESLSIEFVGDLTSTGYMIGSVWAAELMNEYLAGITGIERLLIVDEKALGISGEISEFDYWVPGLMILSLIMLMFTATIAMVAEVENKTIVWLKLSDISTFELFAGIGLVQITVGMLSIILTLLTAVLLGFDYVQSLGGFFLIALLTEISIISFSLILAGLTRTVNEVLIVGNFPLFLFMFFSGVAFPIHSRELFSIAGYPISWQSLMSPSHAVSAINKLWIMGLGLGDIMPEIISILVISLVYLLIGIWLFNRRHMKVL